MKRKTNINRRLKILSVSTVIVSLLILNTAFAQNETIQTCDPLRSNEETAGVTTSDHCIKINIKEGILYLSKIPKSFSFPLKSLTFYGNNQPVFSNTKGTTGPNGVTDPFGNIEQFADEDVLTVTDLRNSGGFQVTLTAGRFSSGPEDEIPLSNLYVATTYPTANDLPDHPELLGIMLGGITYSADYYGLHDITDTVDTVNPVNIASTFTSFGRSFDNNHDNQVEPIVLMYTESGHAGSFSNALSFYVNIPGAQPAGTYSTLFTIDLIPL
jgi:hypothetical protein